MSKSKKKPKSKPVESFTETLVEIFRIDKPDEKGDEHEFAYNFRITDMDTVDLSNVITLLEIIKTVLVEQYAEECGEFK